MRKTQFFIINAIIFSAIFFMGCFGEITDCPDQSSMEDTPVGVTVKYDWSEVKGYKYRYAPVIMEADGKRYMYYCANWKSGIIKDSIVMRVGTKEQDNWVYGEEIEAIHYGEREDWDGQHVCDPTIIAGDFNYSTPGEVQQKKYKYALFYLGYPAGEYEKYPNQIGVALAEKPEGPWIKINKNPLIHADKWWGVGQSSAASLDKKGKIGLFYTEGIVDEDIVQTLYQELDLSDANEPVLKGPIRNVTLRGLIRKDGAQDFTNAGGAFMYAPKKEYFYMIRGKRPFCDVCPGIISDRLQIYYIPKDQIFANEVEWELFAELNGDINGLPNRKLFDAGFVRDAYGALPNVSKLEALVSASRFGDFCCLFFNCLDSYRIHKVVYSLNK